VGDHSPYADWHQQPGMENWKHFKSFKQRGEWVELRFMATAAERGFHILKPWGDTRPYDVGIDRQGSMIRIQVKGFSARKGGGYLCRLRHGGAGEQGYNPVDLDLFAIYIIPAEAWYLIPAASILLPTPKMHITFYPAAPPSRPGRHTGEHDFEGYREAWHLLGLSGKELKHHRRKSTIEVSRS
jgi:hypothetical protein